MGKDGRGAGGPHSARREQGKPYKLVSRTVEGRKPVFGGVFNTLDSRFLDHFACVSGNTVSVYRCLYGNPTEKLQTYKDKDESECFYTAAWLSGAAREPLLAVSGSSGVVKVIDISGRKVVHNLTGHGGSVNEIRTHCGDPSIFITTSKDESLRIWNGVTGVCALVLGGARGHRNEVLSADFHPLDKCVVASCGMDSSIRVWGLHHWWQSVEDSRTWRRSDGTNGRAFPTKIVQFPTVVLQKIHTNYVDCLRWFGNFALTKSVDNEVVLWRLCSKPPSTGSDAMSEHVSDMLLEPWSTCKSETSVYLETRCRGPSAAEALVDILLKLNVPGCDIWFLKFSLDASCSVLALGNREGKTYLWNMGGSQPSQLAQLSTRECKSSIRQTAVSFCGRTVMCCCDDGTVWRWERSPKEGEK